MHAKPKHMYASQQMVLHKVSSRLCINFQKNWRADVCKYFPLEPMHNIVVVLFSNNFLKLSTDIRFLLEQMYYLDKVVEVNTFVLRYHVNEVGYYGVPRDIMMNGRDTDGQLCGTKDSSHRKNPECREMEKTFFLQYQYIAFLLLALSLLYYAPYFLFKKVNEDIVSLKGSIQGIFHHHSKKVLYSMLQGQDIN